MEDILVHLIVAAAVLFMARWVYRNFRAGKSQPGCNSCERCAPEPEEQHAPHSTHETPAHSSPYSPKG